MEDPPRLISGGLRPSSGASSDLLSARPISRSASRSPSARPSSSQATSEGAASSRSSAAPPADLCEAWKEAKVEAKAPAFLSPTVPRRRSAAICARASMGSTRGSTRGSISGDGRRAKLVRMPSRDFRDTDAFARAGMLVDSVLRKSKEVGVKRVSEFAPIQHLLNIHLDRERAPMDLRTFASSMLKREELQDQMMKLIVEERKQRGAFKRTTFKHLVEWTRLVRDGRHEVKQIREKVMALVEVWQWLTKSKPAKPESLWGKKRRLEDYWSTFHDRSNIVVKGTNGSSRGNKGVGAACGAANAPHRNAPSRGSIGLPPPACGLSWDFKEGIHWKAFGEQSRPASRVGTAPASVGAAGRLNTPPVRGKPLTRPASLPNLTKGGPKWPCDADDDGSPGGFSDAGGFTPTRSAGKVLPPLASSKTRYLQECDCRKMPPRPLALLMGNKNLDISGKDFVDSELLAVAATIKGVEVVEVVDLSGNSLLTDKSLVPLLRQLAMEPRAATLDRVNMANCLKAGPHTIDATVTLLKASMNLRVLDLSHMMIPARFQLPLCQAIGRHRTLEFVNLSETGLQHHEMTKECLRAALLSRSLISLDISWNSFNGEVFRSLGGNVVNSSSLARLSVANCASVVGSISPLSLFLEQLATDKTLTSLDISMNSCDFRTSLILEDALDTNRNLREINLCQNPLGGFGLRSILRLVCREHTGLEVFRTEACYQGATDMSGQMVYSFTNPGGKYDLHLDQPYSRTMLRMLYKAMASFDLQPEEAFNIQSYKIKGKATPWKHAQKDHHGIWLVPYSGDVSLVFNVQHVILKRFMNGPGAGSDMSISDFLKGYYDVMRFKPTPRKIIPVLACWKDLRNDPQAQEVFLDALSKDFSISMGCLEYMVEACKPMGGNTISHLLPLVPGGSGTIYRVGLLFQTLPQSVTEFATAHRQILPFTGMNVDNPTGRYVLDLANCSEFAVAERLLLIDRWEAAIDVKLGRKDISCWGNMSHVRNETYQNRKLVGGDIKSVSEWQLPEHGSLFLDYVSNFRPSRSAEVLRAEVWVAILLELHQADCTSADKIAALRAISHCFHLGCNDVRKLLGYFEASEDRIEVLVVFYMRIVDMHNAKIFRVKFADREIVELQRRLGYVVFFPFLQPENATFELDLSKHDQRLCAAMYIYLADKEKYPQNLHDYKYVRANGVQDPMITGVPRSWGDFNFKSIPADGTFTATYRCAPEDRQFARRRELASTYGFFDVQGLRDDEVLWWTGLAEPPPDVIRLLKFFWGKFKDLQEPFIRIDGVNGNGDITLQELLKGLDDMECTLFDVPPKVVPTKEQRIEAIFRYLDPGGEGSVSRYEWGILEQLWKELDLSMQEFADFLMLTNDSLEEAWDTLDEDESGFLSEEEWTRAVERTGYFGPTKVSESHCPPRAQRLPGARAPDRPRGGLRSA